MNSRELFLDAQFTLYGVKFLLRTCERECIDFINWAFFFVIVGESLKILHSELKQQRKLVRSLKKKSLWSRNLEEVHTVLTNCYSY